MGCFNMTCAVSRLPITDQMPIRAFVLARPQALTNENFIFYPDTFFLPLTTGVKGVYNDYGGIDKLKQTSAFNVGAKHFFPGIGMAKLLDRSPDDIRTLKVKHFGTEYECDVSIAFVREDIYQKTLALGGWGSVDRAALKKELEELKKPIVQAQSMQKAAEKLLPGKAGLSLDDCLPMSMLTLGASFRSLGSLFGTREGSLLSDVLNPYRTKLIDMLTVKGKVTDEAVDFAAEIQQYLRFNSMLKQLCILWQPATNMVGQETPYKLHRAFNDMVNAVCDAEIEEQRKENAEFEADEPPLPVRRKPADLKLKA